VLGIGRENVRMLAVDDRQRMRPADLEAAIDEDLAAGRVPVAVVANAGTTNTGAIDPLRPIGEIARARRIWFHVDGAYGLPGILDDRVAPRYDGLDLADSVIVDPHKWLNAPVGIAATFVRDRAILQRAFTQGAADYLEGSFTHDVEVSIDAMGIPYADFGVELSATARGVQVWAILREEGSDGVAARIRRDNDFARFVTDACREHPRLEALTEPELSIACVRYRAGAGSSEESLNDLNARIHRRLVRETPYLASTTVVAGRFAIRPCFINPRTTWDMVHAFVAELVRIGDEETDRHTPLEGA
jgi:aromatic-L-amino-acid decarboxylase